MFNSRQMKIDSSWNLSVQNKLRPKRDFGQLIFNEINKPGLFLIACLLGLLRFKANDYQQLI